MEEGDEDDVREATKELLDLKSRSAREFCFVGVLFVWRSYFFVRYFGCYGPVNSILCTYCSVFIVNAYVYSFFFLFPFLGLIVAASSVQTETLTIQSDHGHSWA